MPYEPDVGTLLHRLIEVHGSDLHLKVGSPPCLRIHGEVERVDAPILMPDDTREMLLSMLSTAQRKEFEEEHELDFAYAVPRLSRFRVNVFLQRGSIGAVFRTIPLAIPTAAELGLPPVVLELAMRPRGLVLVTGPTGSGKSTTLAAMVDHVNKNRKCHIMTIEDPIEFLHRDQMAIVNQREVGADTNGFAQALRRVLRQDPDVILVGEMRDLETISAACTAAETGHLVFGTLHTSSAPSTIDRVIDVFPPVPAGADPHAALDHAAGGHLADAAAQGERRPRGRPRGDGLPDLDRQPHPGVQDPPDGQHHPIRQPLRHAHARPESHRTGGQRAWSRTRMRWPRRRTSPASKLRRDSSRVGWSDRP